MLGFGVPVLWGMAYDAWGSKCKSTLRTFQNDYKNALRASLWCVSDTATTGIAFRIAEAPILRSWTRRKTFHSRIQMMPSIDDTSLLSTRHWGFGSRDSGAIKLVPSFLPVLPCNDRVIVVKPSALDLSNPQNERRILYPQDPKLRKLPLWGSEL